MHTYSLLNDHSDRSTMIPAQVPLLDQFLEGQKALQASLLERIAANPNLKPELKSEDTIADHFRLLQASDYLSLLTCVDFQKPVELLHALPARGGKRMPVQVRAIATRHFVLNPYPFAEPAITFPFPARHAKGKHFSSAKELQDAFNAAPVETLSVTVSAV
jgi:hypothetical protein